ncbi:hypothetical protein LSAT2_024572 [Lamellibrachia satsuma]|nr:hypothetical protein LSAT2_024572 [Lamellibrachia satsuma]
MSRSENFRSRDLKHGRIQRRIQSCCVQCNKKLIHHASHMNHHPHKHRQDKRRFRHHGHLPSHHLRQCVWTNAATKLLIDIVHTNMYDDNDEKVICHNGM